MRTALITIKRYPNRRLYDTTRSQYINLDYIRELVISNQDFEILDSKTKEDKTRSILIQIISEAETSAQQSLLTNVLLKKLICFYGNDNQSYLQQFLEQSLSAFLEQQDNVKGIVKELNKNSPIGLFNSVIEQNLSLWGNLKKPKTKD